MVLTGALFGWVRLTLPFSDPLRDFSRTQGLLI